MIYFTSDLHFGHKNIIDFCDRPWNSVDAMNKGLIDNWNDTVGNDNLVYVLGDVCMGKIDKSLQLLTQLKGIKRLVPGNHDRCWIGNGPKHEKWIQRYEDVGFHPTAERYFRTSNEMFLLDHFPYEGDSHDKDRYVEHRPVDTGLWLLCGHVHDAWKVSGRQINVGTDVWDYRPVAAQTLIDLKKSYDT